MSLILLGMAACSGPDGTQLQALRSGRDAVLPCQERFHEQSQTYVDCVRYVAQAGSKDLTPALLAWRRLGALYTGWVHADLVGQQGDAPAAAGARTLLREARTLQQQLQAPQPALCDLVGIPCARIDNRMQELQAQDSSGQR